MLSNGIKYASVFATLALLSAAACSDDETTGTTATTNNNTTNAGGGTTTGGGGGGTTTGGGGGSTPGCAEACSTLYDCGTEADGADNLCPGFTGDPAEKDAFVEGCIENCEATPALINFVDAENCPMTVETIKGVSPDFLDVCENGFGMGGAGGTGGAGGAGGAGGN